MRICQKVIACASKHAYEFIRCNVDNHHCECLLVLKEEGVCHGAVGIVSQSISYLMRSQIHCNYPPVQFLHIYHPQDGRVH